MKSRSISLTVAAIALAVCAPLSPAYAGSNDDNYLAVGDSVAYGVGVSTPYPELVDDLSRGIDLAANLSTSAATTGGVAAQLATYGKPSAIKELTITVGANDVGWGDALLACLGGACPSDAQLTAALGALRHNLTGVLVGAKDHFPNATISVTGYYELFGDKAKPCPVAIGTTISVANKTWLNTAVRKLNTTIAAAAADAGARVVFVDVAKAFQGHGLCDTGLPWVITGLRPDAAGHPNVLGQAAYAVVLNKAGVR